MDPYKKIELFIFRKIHQKYITNQQMAKDNPNKKAPNPKIKHTAPGESLRSKKPKPIEDRVGHNDNKSWKFQEREFPLKEDFRGRKGGLSGLGRRAIQDPDGFNPFPHKPSGDQPYVFENSNFHTTTKKWTDKDGFVRLNRDGHGFEIWEDEFNVTRVTNKKM